MKEPFGTPRKLNDTVLLAVSALLISTMVKPADSLLTANTSVGVSLLAVS